MLREQQRGLPRPTPSASDAVSPTATSRHSFHRLAPAGGVGVATPSNTAWERPFLTATLSLSPGEAKLPPDKVSSGCFLLGYREQWYFSGWMILPSIAWGKSSRFGTTCYCGLQSFGEQVAGTLHREHTTAEQLGQKVGLPCKKTP